LDTVDTGVDTDANGDAIISVNMASPGTYTFAVQIQSYSLLTSTATTMVITRENTNIGVALNYDFNTWLDIETSYNQTKLSSTLVGTSYVKNEFALTFLGKL
ncbi:MAG: hypothetical protein JKX87_06865, partial [Cycloclasticus sp.]|nr:hypothetical protein [Cycloclasticus sp.]